MPNAPENLVRSLPAMSLQEAKTHLRISNSEYDDDVKQQLEAAQDYCESVTGRSFRQVQTQLLYAGFWQTTFCFDHQPVKQIVAVQYDDPDGATQTVDVSMYELVRCWQSYLQFLSSFNFPALAANPNAILIHYETGWDEMPERAKQLIKAQLSLTWGDLTHAEANATHRLRDALITSWNYGYR